MNQTTVASIPAGPEQPRDHGGALVVRGVSQSYPGHGRVLQDIQLAVAPGEVLSLLGPSGCGKTTLLRVIAGLEVPSAGTVELGGRLLSGPGVQISPERRGVAMVFQDWALFPHLDVAANIGFGLPRGQRRSSQRITDTLGLVGLEGLGDRMPDTLSGGQQQRVALGRALAQRADVVLLDEPFSNLDFSLRARVRRDTRRLLADLDMTAILVTHDRDEAFVLGDRVALMRSGSIVQTGEPEQLYRFPVDRWSAGFLGAVVLLDGTGRGTVADTALGEVSLSEPRNGPIQVVLRPEQLELRPASATRSGAAVVAVEYHGPRTTYEVEVRGVCLAVEARGASRFEPGDAVRVLLPRDRLASFPV